MTEVVLNDRKFAGKQTGCGNRDHRDGDRFEIRPKMGCALDDHDTRGGGVQSEMGELGKVQALVADRSYDYNDVCSGIQNSQHAACAHSCHASPVHGSGVGNAPIAQRLYMEPLHEWPVISQS